MNRANLKNYAPQARREFIQVMKDRAAFYGLKANKIEPVYALAKAAGIADSFHRYTRDDSGKKPKVIHHDD